LQAKLHKLDSRLKKYITDQQAGGEKFKIVVNNFMVYSIQTGKNTTNQIAEIIGIDKEIAEKWLDDMVEKKIINKKDNIYSI
jgi:hypothetical protein